ncbi:MAG: hypothetical protein Q9174_002264 [Haloplaca sp. 1 TL-2023]
MPPTTVCFDLLPAEIRVQIYRQTLAIDQEDQRMYRINGPQTLVSIAQVSRKLRREAMEVLFGARPVPFSIHIRESMVTFYGKRLVYSRLHKFTPPVALGNITNWLITIDDEWHCPQNTTGEVPTTATQLFRSEWFDKVYALHFHCPQRANLRQFVKGTPIGHLVRTCILSTHEDDSFQETMMELLNRFAAPHLAKSHELQHLLDIASHTLDYGGLKFEHAFDGAVQCLHDLLQGPGQRSRGSITHYPPNLSFDQIRDSVSRRREQMDNDRESHATFIPDIPTDWFYAAFDDRDPQYWKEKELAAYLLFVDNSFMVVPEGIPIPWAAFFRHYLPPGVQKIPISSPQ